MFSKHIKVATYLLTLLEYLQFNILRWVLVFNMRAKFASRPNKCYVYIGIYERKYLKSFKMWCWRRMEEINWYQRKKLKRENSTLLNNILSRKVNWIVHILRINSLFHDVIEGQMAEVKVVERRRTQLIDDLKKEETKC